MTVTQAQALCSWYLLKGGGAVVLVGTGVLGVAAGAVAFKWVKGMLFG